MTVQATPMWVQAGSHNAEDMRRLVSALMGNRPGITKFADLQVTQHAGTVNMSVDVADGRLFVPGSESSYQGFYYGENRGVTNLPVAASNATNPRFDLVVARIYDAAYATGPNSKFALEVITGTPAASPVEPPIPANAFVLARIIVSAGVTSITNGSITDRRFTTYARAVAAGGVIAADTSANLPATNVETGALAFTYNTAELWYWNGATWAKFGAAATSWSAPTLVNSWQNFGAGYVSAGYRKVGDIVYLRGTVSKSAGTPAVNETLFQLPTGFRPPNNHIFPATDGSGTSHRLDVYNTGEIKWVAGSAANAAALLTLSVISFSTV